MYQVNIKMYGNTKIKIFPSVDKGHVLIRILVKCLRLQRTKNDKERHCAQE